MRPKQAYVFHHAVRLLSRCSETSCADHVLHPNATLTRFSAHSPLGHPLLADPGGCAESTFIDRVFYAFASLLLPMPRAFTRSGL